MPRVKRGVAAHKKHKKLLQMAEGHRGTRKRLFRPAHESVMRSMAYMYRDRRTRKRDMRRLWITRINAAARLHGVSYSKLMHAIHTANIDVDRIVQPKPVLAVLRVERRVSLQRHRACLHDEVIDAHALGIGCHAVHLFAEGKR